MYLYIWKVSILCQHTVFIDTYNDNIEIFNQNLYLYI